jgi:murein DD-endopeptidase MepM/ murein hydrolase activator NlpD
MHVVRPSTLVVALTFVLLACGSDDGGDDGDDGFPPLTAAVDPEPGPGNVPMRMFGRPFASEYAVLNYFDHDRPVAPNDTNGFQLTWRGARAFPQRDRVGYDGHTGIDWLLPENTPLLAVTDGEIVFAGENTFACFLENDELRTNLTVTIRFIGLDGMAYGALYTHLNRVDVAVGDQVVEGEQIGLSGVTGCVGPGRIPHLHFEVLRVVNENPIDTEVLDPYGWEGPTPDPWAAGDPRRASYWFWKAGQAPDLPRR